MKIRLCLFEGNCTNKIIFYWFLVFDHNLKKKHCILYAIYGNANKKVVNQYL